MKNIKEFEDYINEGFMSSIASRMSDPDKVRKEDEIGNIDEIKFIDMGTSVLWADKDFILDDKEYFNFKEANKLIELPVFKNRGYRLPTNKDLQELGSTDILVTENEDSFILSNTSGSLTFYKNGYLDGYSNIVKDKGSYYYGQTSEIYDHMGANTNYSYTFENTNFIYTPKIPENFNDIFDMHQSNGLSVRLVKDK